MPPRNAQAAANAAELWKKRIKLARALKGA